MSLLAATLAALTALASGVPPPGLDLPPDLAAGWARLARGEVLVAADPAGGERRAVRAAVLIEAPAERVWAVMVDCGRAPEFVPGLKECRVLEEDGDRLVLQHRVRISGLLPEVSYRFRADHVPNRRIDFARIDGDLRAMEGSWVLAPLDAGRRTLVRYSVYLDPGFLVPQWAVRRALRRDLPALLHALREQVRAEGPPP